MSSPDTFCHGGRSQINGGSSDTSMASWMLRTSAMSKSALELVRHDAAPTAMPYAKASATVREESTGTQAAAAASSSLHHMCSVPAAVESPAPMGDTTAPRRADCRCTAQRLPECTSTTPPGKGPSVQQTEHTQIAAGCDLAQASAARATVVGSAATADSEPPGAGRPARESTSRALSFTTVWQPRSAAAARAAPTPTTLSTRTRVPRSHAARSSCV
mmetsp:Transcript_82059/g.214078  ORF Transcript_82059/g.214078 Transcript_82059/m.214078 type:complete len:217 (-) Transcript_82059:119-769(-)